MKQIQDLNWISKKYADSGTLTFLSIVVVVVIAVLSFALVAVVAMCMSGWLALWAATGLAVMFDLEIEIPMNWNAAFITGVALFVLGGILKR